jgi:hypothetical protein
MNEFFLLPSARLLRELHAESATFDHVAAQIAATMRVRRVSSRSLTPETGRTNASSRG